MSVTYYIQVILTLVLLGAFLFVLLRFSKNWKDKKFSGEIQILDRTPLDSNVTIFIIKVRQKEYLLSLGGKDVKLLQTL